MTVAGSKTQFDLFLEQEAARVRGVYFPVKTDLLRRRLIREADCDRLHPNPDDEFCMPEIGPNYKIISDYQQQYLAAIKMAQPYYDGEPIIVERTHPDGYMIVNGHHRWAAALRMGQSRIPIRIVNLMHEEDVRAILANSRHTRRVALDLDEEVFRAPEDGAVERALPFPWDRVFPERIRLGVPALFHFLAKRGYDIWLYSSQYYSADYIRNCFARYHVKVDGVLTAVGKKGPAGGETGRKLEKLITDKYDHTLHIDSAAAVWISKKEKSFRDVQLSGNAESWSREVMEAVEALEKAAEDRNGHESIL